MRCVCGCAALGGAVSEGQRSGGRDGSLDGTVVPGNALTVHLAAERLNPCSRLPAICWQRNEFSKVLHNWTVEQICSEAGDAEKLSALAFSEVLSKTK